MHQGRTFMVGALKEQRLLILILFVSFLIRSVVAMMTELGNDEVYYTTYAKYPDWSHFDHPPMIGWLIRVFSINLQLHHEFFIRLGALVAGLFATLFASLTAIRLNGYKAGIITALLFSTSFYAAVVSGTFILPDSPQLAFWMAFIYLLVLIDGDKIPLPVKRKLWLLAGLAGGLALLSKYTSVFLWVGVFLYALLYRRKWLASGWLYAAVVVSFLIFIPVLLWNMHNSFISFSFHGGRVGTAGYEFRPDYFLTELGGEALYQNPVNFIIILSSLFIFIRHPRRLECGRRLRLLACFGLPLVFLFLLFSFFRPMLPHWNGPGYATLSVLAGVIFAGSGKQHESKPVIRWPICLSAIVFVFVTITAIAQVRTGFLSGMLSVNEQPGAKGEADFSLDLFGWKQLGKEFGTLRQNDLEKGLIGPGAPMLSWRWFPAANLEFYVAGPAGMKTYALGDTSRIHKYAWINGIHGTIPAGSDAYFIASSRDFKDPATLLGGLYRDFQPPDTVGIMRGGSVAMYFYVYRLRGALRDIDPASVR